MFFQNKDGKLQETERYEVIRSDASNPLSSYAAYAFERDGAEWPTAEHYYQAMKFEDADYRERIRQAATPEQAAKLGKSWFKKRRQDWKKNRITYMTRANYIKCRTHPQVAKALTDSGEKLIADLTMYDYFWGTGRDLRGGNHFGKMLMGIRSKLREESQQDAS